jgi:hypothetical protein
VKKRGVLCESDLIHLNRFGFSLFYPVGRGTTKPDDAFSREMIKAFTAIGVTAD